MTVTTIVAVAAIIYFARHATQYGTTQYNTVDESTSLAHPAFTVYLPEWLRQAQADNPTQIDNTLQVDTQMLLGEPMTVVTIPRSSNSAINPTVNPPTPPPAKTEQIVAAPAKAIEPIITTAKAETPKLPSASKNIAMEIRRPPDDTAYKEDAIKEAAKPPNVPPRREPVMHVEVHSPVASLQQPQSPMSIDKAEPMELEGVVAMPMHRLNTDLLKYSSDTKIIAALGTLKEINAKEIFDNLDVMNAEIKFYDFELLGYEYRKHYAISTKKNGRALIAINSRYKDSPAEAIACLIVHESFHKLKKATLDEEVFCTTMEAKYWKLLKVPGRRYSDEDVLVFKLDNWTTMYLAITSDNNPIRAKITNSSFYKDRLAYLAILKLMS